MNIVELTGEAEIRASYPVMHELRMHLDEAAYVAQVQQMMRSGYRLIALYDDEVIQALAGIERGLNLYNGRHMFVHDLVTAAESRSKGYGRALLSYIEDMARDEDCERVVLTSGVQRVDAHRFYEQHMDYTRAGYVFKKVL